MGEIIVPVDASIDVSIINDKPSFSAKLATASVVSVPDVGLCMLGDLTGTVVCWHGPGRPPGLTLTAKGITKTFAREPNSLGMDGDSHGYAELIWDFSPLEKRSMEIDKNLSISPAKEVSFAPLSVIGVFHVSLRQTYHLSTSNFGVSIKLSPR